jgi:hypothetical protein
MEKLFEHTHVHDGMSSAEKNQAVQAHFSRKDKKEKEMEGMIPSAYSGKKDKQAASNTSFNPFMKAKDLGSKVGTRATLVLTGTARMNMEGNFGPQIIVGVIHNKKEFDLGVKVGKSSHQILEKKFGRNPKKWKGKKITAEIREYMNNKFIQLVG